MTPEVKKRIEQIRQGIVPEGYKKTESGIIPNEWRAGQVRKCIEEYKFFSNDISHIPVYSSSRKGLVPQSDYYNQREAVETNLGYKVVPQGYVTYRHMSDDDVFHFNINKTGENVLVSSEYPVFTSSDNCDLSFLISVLNNTARFRYFCKMQKLGGTRTRLYLDNLKRYALALPPFDEQKKIAEILATQDKAIELQGRKIDELKRFKKGCLEKMFPRKGQKVPEKRFPGFTDDWEQRKLVSLCEKFTDGDWIEAKDQSHSGVRLIQTGNVGSGEYIDKPSNKKWISEETFRRLNCEEVFAGDILISRLPEPAGRACIVPNLGTKMITAVDCTIVRTATKTNSKYLLQFLSSQSYFDEVNTCLVGGTRQRISRSNLAAFDVPIPAKYEEQKAIGEFLCGIDNLITLHQRKLDEMKKQKKALMQLLLTGIVRVRL